MKRPVIGITQDVELKKEGPGYWGYLVNAYADAVYRYGGLPLLLPVMEDSVSAREFAGQIDGLLLSGGDDIHPRYYGEALQPETCLSPDVRTEFDMAIFREMLALDRPVLGICLGIQTMNVYFGGTLHQDMPGHKEKGGEARHEVSVADGSMLRGILGVGRLVVNSYHHQSIKGLGAGLAASALSTDNVIEAVELTGRRFVAGVQWHPEKMPDDIYTERLFRAFIGACG